MFNKVIATFFFLPGLYALQPCYGQEPQSSTANNSREIIMELQNVQREVLAYAETLRVKNKPYGCYRSAPDKETTFYASCDVAIMRTVMGEDLQKSLTARQRKEWIETLNGYAQTDGSYQRYTHHSYLHANGMVIGALGVLGGKQKHPIKLYNDFNTVAKIVPWLENKVDWKGQWSGSHLFWGGMHCFSLSKKCTDAWRAKAFDWLDAHLDPQTGWWHKDVPTTEVERLGGACHIWPIYQHNHRTFPYPRQVIDRLLKMQRRDGSWHGHYPSYLEMDALYGLAYMTSLAPKHREIEIRKAVEKHARYTQKGYAPFMAQKMDLHNTLSVVSRFGLLNQLLPKAFPTPTPWTDIFSDIRLYQTGKVERLRAAKDAQKK